MYLKELQTILLSVTAEKKMVEFERGISELGVEHFLVVGSMCSSYYRRNQTARDG